MQQYWSKITHTKEIQRMKKSYGNKFINVLKSEKKKYVFKIHQSAFFPLFMVINKQRRSQQ